MLVFIPFVSVACYVIKTLGTHPANHAFLTRLQTSMASSLSTHVALGNMEEINRILAGIPTSQAKEQLLSAEMIPAARMAALKNLTDVLDVFLDKLGDDAVDLLLDNKLTHQWGKMTLLHCACVSQRNVDMVRLLVARVPPDRLAEAIFAVDNSGLHSLYYAAGHRIGEIFCLLAGCLNDHDWRKAMNEKHASRFSTDGRRIQLVELAVRVNGVRTVHSIVTRARQLDCADGLRDVVRGLEMTEEMRRVIEDADVPLTPGKESESEENLRVRLKLREPRSDV